MAKKFNANYYSKKRIKSINHELTIVSNGDYLYSNGIYPTKIKEEDLPEWYFKYCYYYSRFKHEDAFFLSDDYDLIVCFDTLACIKEQQKFLKTLYNHTSKEGYLLLAVPNFSCEPLNQDGTIAIPTHINKYTIEIIRKILKNAKYQILDIYGQPFSNIMMNREYTLITKYNLSEKKVKSYYGYKKEYIDYFARLMAYPTTKQVEVSYYFIVLAKKI